MHLTSAIKSKKLVVIGDRVDAKILYRPAERHPDAGTGRGDLSADSPIFVGFRTK